MASERRDRYEFAAQVLRRMRERRAGPRIGTLSGAPIHDFIEAPDGSRWSFSGKNFQGRVLASTDIVHHQAVYSLNG